MKGPAGIIGMFVSCMAGHGGHIGTLSIAFSFLEGGEGDEDNLAAEDKKIGVQP